MVSDVYPGQGPLAGVHAGLNSSNHDKNFIVACDMPFVSAELAEVLVQNMRRLRCRHSRHSWNSASFVCCF